TGYLEPGKDISERRSMITLATRNRRTICVALTLVGLMAAATNGQVNIEDEAAEKSPFELLWGFDTGG
ncbi:MAG: hypothetical protein ACE5GA_11440, partial [Candidatus Zixiibacteriota bacterium]